MERNSTIAVPMYIKSISQKVRSYLLRYWESPSHEGWLIILNEYGGDDEDEDEDEESNLNTRNWKEGDCCLWNPLTSQTIMLPSLLPWLEGYHLFPDCCVLSSPPNNLNSSMVFFLFRNLRSSPNHLLFCSPGEKRWRTQPLNSLNAYQLIWSKASNKLYIANFYKNEIHRVEKLEPELSVNSITITNNNSHPWEKDFNRFGVQIKYMECGADHELFKVVRILYRPGDYYKTFYVKVSKLKYAASSMTNNYSWEEVKSMGDHVLFIGEDTIATLSASKLGLTKGCVYFTHMEDESLYKFDPEDDSISVYSYSSNLLIRSNLPTDHRVAISNGRRDHGILRTNVAEKSMLIAGLETITSRGVMQPRVISPCLIFRTKSDPIWNLVDYTNNKYHIELPEILSDATEIRFSKGGWILILKGNKSPFFLNPFTRDTIPLPDLPIEKSIGSGIVSGFSFSSLPTSLDCVVFAIENDYKGSVVIYSISRGNNRWISRWFYKPQVTSNDNRIIKTFMPWLNNPVFFDGDFYCLDHEGALGVFKKEQNDGTWNVLAKPENPCNTLVSRSFLVECEGKLLSVFLGHLGKDVRIFRLDISNMNWVKVESLHKHMLFISGTSSMSAIAPNSLMENKIYFDRIHGDGILYYCLETSRYHSFGSQHSAENFYDTKNHLNCSWIEPNWSLYSAQELDWSNLEL